MSICENGAIVALKQSIADLSSHVVEDGLLVDVLTKDLIKTKVILLYFYCLFIQDIQEILLRLLFDCFGLQPNEDSNVLLFIDTFALFHSRSILVNFALIIIETRRQIDFDIERTTVLFLQCKFAIALHHLLG